MFSAGNPFVDLKARGERSFDVTNCLETLPFCCYLAFLFSPSQKSTHNLLHHISFFVYCFVLLYSSIFDLSWSTYTWLCAASNKVSWFKSLFIALLVRTGSWSNERFAAYMCFLVFTDNQAGFIFVCFCFRPKHKPADYQISVNLVEST